MEEEVHAREDDENTTRPSKQQRRSLKNPLEQTEICNIIVSYLGDIRDLLAWDLTCKEFRNAGEEQWGVLAAQRFGCSVDCGKQGWRMARSYMQKPILVEMVDDHDFGHGDYFAGSPETTTNQSLLVTVSDDIDNRLYMDFPFGRNGISMRDANTLNFIRTVESPVPNWNVAICGRLGCEIIVTSNPAGLSAFRGDQRKVWSLNSNETLRGAQGSHAFPILGCENHLLVVTCYRVYLFKVGAGDEDLVVQKMAVPIGGSDTESRVSKACSPPENVAWSPCRAYFSFYDKQTRQICIWEYSDENESITPINSISAGDLSITTVALSESYVIGTSSQKKFSVWDHQSGKLCHRELCDVVDTTGGDSDSENDELIWALRMFVVDGDFLAATSRQGNALCFWNLRKGKLLKRHTDAFEKIADELPDGVDVTSMEHLIDLNAFVCMQGTMMVWAFPSNTKQKKKIASIRRREKSIASVQTQDLFY